MPYAVRKWKSVTCDFLVVWLLFCSVILECKHGRPCFYVGAWRWGFLTLTLKLLLGRKVHVFVP